MRRKALRHRKVPLAILVNKQDLREAPANSGATYFTVEHVCLALGIEMLQVNVNDTGVTTVNDYLRCCDATKHSQLPYTGHNFSDGIWVLDTGDDGMDLAVSFEANVLLAKHVSEFSVAIVPFQGWSGASKNIAF